jgi:DUF971 family protein
MAKPTNLQIIGNIVAIAWSDGSESFLPAPYLRARSPSAEVSGERDIFGQTYGGGAGKGSDDVAVIGWEWIGNYAIRFEFSDGHRTGLYSYDYLKKLTAELPPET